MGKRISTNIQIRFSDVDLMGHVNNAVYLNYFEVARMNYFNEILGHDWDWISNGILLANNTIDYHYPLLLNDAVQVETRCIKVGTKSFVLEYNLFVLKESDKVKYASGHSTLVCYNYNEKQSIPVPEKLKMSIL
ncbi:MAG: acyl-CoA thioesterase [Crocinitomicaceae bacterium]